MTGIISNFDVRELQGQLRDISTSILSLKRLIESKGINEVTASMLLPDPAHHASVAPPVACSTRFFFTLVFSQLAVVPALIVGILAGYALHNAHDAIHNSVPTAAQVSRPSHRSCDAHGRAPPSTGAQLHAWHQITRSHKDNITAHSPG